MFQSPNIVGLKKINKTIELPNINKSSTFTIDAILGRNILIIGIPYIKVDNEKIVAQIINGGENKITIAITNIDNKNISDAKLDIDAYIINGL